MDQPDFVHTLPSGVEPSNDDVSPHPLFLECVDRQIRDMQRAREQAAVSGRDYLITS